MRRDEKRWTLYFLTEQKQVQLTIKQGNWDWFEDTLACVVVMSQKWMENNLRKPTANPKNLLLTSAYILTRTIRITSKWTKRMQFSMIETKGMDSPFLSNSVNLCTVRK
jgi:hypothetical protein